MAERTLAEVFVSVRPDVSGTGRELDQKLSRIDTSSSGRKAGHSFGHAFSGAAKTIIGGLGASVAALGVGKVLSDSVKGFRDHQRVTAQTAAALKSTGNAAHTSVGAIERLSDALERKSTVDGDVIQSGANMLATFTNVQNRVGKGNDIFNRATATVLDMSVALGQDTKNSAIQLGKALNDPVKGVTALQRVGVTFTAQQKKQIDGMVKAGNVAGAQKLILAELNKEFGGSAAAQGKAAGAQGRLLVAWRQAQDTIGKALLPVVNELEGALADRLPGAAEKAAAGIMKGTVGVHAMIAAFHEGDVTSDGFVGGMERIGVAARKLQIGVRALIAAYKEGDVTSDGFVGAMEKIGVALRRAHDYLAGVDFHKLTTDIGSFASRLKGVDVHGLAVQMQSVDTSHFADGLNVAGRILGFFADHIDLVVKALPVLIAGFALYKASQAAANVHALAMLPIQAAQVAGNILLARSIKSLAVAQTQQAATTGANTATQLVNTAVLNAGAAAMIRGKIAALASAAAQRAVAAATVVWTVVQRGLNLVLLANPIGLVIAAIAALAAGVIYAYKHSDTFRKIVDGAFRAVATAGQWMWEHVLRPTFKFLVDAWFTVAGAIVNGAARAFGWVPGLGGKLKAAAETFNRFRDSVNRSLNGVHDKQVNVRVQLGAGRAVVGSGANAIRIQKDGGILKRFAQGGEDHVAQVAKAGDWRLWAEPETGGEAYIPLAASKRGRSTKILSSVASQFGYGLVPAAEGLVISPQIAGKRQFDATLAAYDKSLDAFAVRVGKAVQKQLGFANVVNFARSIAGSPYVWGGASPSGSDCSGFLSMLVEVARGQRPGGRLFSTSTLPAGYFATSGNVNRAFRIGWFAGNPGHVAATVNGIGMESRGGDGVVVDGYNGSSRGADYGFFSHHAFLKMARGGILPGDGPFDLLDPRGKHFQPGLLEALKDAQRNGVRSFDGGGVWPSGRLGVNLSGRPERVRSGAQEDALAAKLDRIAYLLETRAVEVRLDSRPIAAAVSRQATRNPGQWGP